VWRRYKERNIQTDARREEKHQRSGESGGAAWWGRRSRKQIMDAERSVER